MLKKNQAGSAQNEETARLVFYQQDFAFIAQLLKWAIRR